jgi:hypothetical protein
MPLKRLKCSAGEKKKQIAAKSSHRAATWRDQKSHALT